MGSRVLKREREREGEREGEVGEKRVCYDRVCYEMIGCVMRWFSSPDGGSCTVETREREGRRAVGEERVRRGCVMVRCVMRWFSFPDGGWCTADREGEKEGGSDEGVL